MTSGSIEQWGFGGLLFLAPVPGLDPVHRKYPSRVATRTLTTRNEASSDAGNPPLGHSESLIGVRPESFQLKIQSEPRYSSCSTCQTSREVTSAEPMPDSKWRFGGGHSVASKSVCDGRLLIDFSLMKGLCGPEDRPLDLPLRPARRLPFPRSGGKRQDGQKPRSLRATAVLARRGPLRRRRCR